MNLSYDPGKMSRRLEKLRTAIFSDLGNSLLKFPVSIVRISRADDNGELWFNLPKPYRDTSDMERIFPASLHFYNKEYDYYIHVEGFASIVPEGHERFGGLDEQRISPEEIKLMIRVKIKNMEYFHRRIRSEKTLYNKISHSIKWLFRPEEEHHLSYTH
jgi:hypothetical protein